MQAQLGRPPPQAGRPGEGGEGEEGLFVVAAAVGVGGVGVEAGDRAQLGQADLAPGRAVEAVLAQVGDGVLGRRHQQRPAGDHHPLDHRAGGADRLVDDRLPVLGLGPVEVGPDHPAPGRAQVGDGVDAAADDLHPRRRLLALHHHRPLAGLPVEEDDVGAGRHQVDVQGQPPPVVGDDRHGQGRLVEPVDEDRLVGRGVVAHPVPPHRVPVALLALGDGGRVGEAVVGEGRPVGQPGQRRVADVGDGVGQEGAAVDVDDAQGAVLAAALGHAVGEEAAVGGR